MQKQRKTRNASKPKEKGGSASSSPALLGLTTVRTSMVSWVMVVVLVVATFATERRAVKLSDSNVSFMFNKLASNVSFLQISNYDPPPQEVASLSNSNVSWMQITNYDPPLQVAWLVSFPNSGTSYTMTNTRQLSQYQIASNYLKEMGLPRPLYPDQGSSRPPYIEANSSLPLPRKFILTKTHCGGYDAFCRPSEFVVRSAKAMENMCASDKKEAGVVDPYNVSHVVGRVIHLIRNPLDNMVSRMHHDSKRPRNKARLGPSQLERDRLVFWCGAFKAIVPTTMDFLPKNGSSYNILKQPLCGVQIFRYVQWHNRIWEMTTARSIPLLYLYYEDYFTNYDTTVKRILDFLQLPRLQDVDPIPLESNKTYSYLYTQQEIKDIAEFIHTMALPPVWELLWHYFPDYKPAV